MTLRARLSRWERRRPAGDDPDPFPTGEVLHNPPAGSAWLMRHGYADALEAWRDGERSWPVAHAALRCWLRRCGHVEYVQAEARFRAAGGRGDSHTEAGRPSGWADAVAAVEAGEVPPTGLEGLLRRLASHGYFDEAHDGLGLLPPDRQAEYRRLCEQVGGCPDAPWAALMEEFRRLALHVRAARGAKGAGGERIRR